MAAAGCQPWPASILWVFHTDACADMVVMALKQREHGLSDRAAESMRSSGVIANVVRAPRNARQHMNNYKFIRKYEALATYSPLVVALHSLSFLSCRANRHLVNAE